MINLNILTIYTEKPPDTSLFGQLEGKRLAFITRDLDKTLAGRSLDNIDAILIPPDCLISDIQLCSLLDLSIPVFNANADGRTHSSCNIINLHPLSWPPDMRKIEKITASAKSLQPFPPYLPTLPNMSELQQHGIYGISNTFARSMREIKKFSISHAPVLFNGETGTGKELAARYLHYIGPRANEPFIPVNCGSLPDSLFENELFGHEKGAYTDAKSSHNGLIEQAQNGTLFLDEINSLCPRAQACLLRFVQDQQYRPLGSQSPKQANISILAASNSNLEHAVEQGTFRKDLYYRLNSISINLPALRNRKTDISILARHFLRQFCDEYGQHPKSFHPDSIAWLEKQDWPGNVRQLKSLVHREFLINDERIIRIHTDSDKNPRISTAFSTPGHTILKKARTDLVEQFEQEYLHKLMLETCGNVTRAARLAGKERRCLGKMLKKYDIVKEDYI